MSIDWVRQYCLSLPDTSETVQWGNDLVFKVGGKMFAVVALEPSKVWLSFKCSPENFAELTERDGVVPAPYLARAQWVALETETALKRLELKALLREAYDLIHAKLPKKRQPAKAAHARTARP
jgi:predicted DNA-binding protein (MmcQ/YjbR family)